jgi:hypothetical protein
MPSEHLDCEDCRKPIRPGELPVVVEWGKRDASLPGHLGRPISKARHYACEQLRRGVSGMKKEPATGSKQEVDKVKTLTGKGATVPLVKHKPSSNDLQRIYLLRKDNPRKEGTHGWSSWEKVKNGMTVADYLSAGGRRNDLQWDIEHGWAELRDK